MSFLIGPPRDQSRFYTAPDQNELDNPALNLVSEDRNEASYSSIRYGQQYVNISTTMEHYCPFPPYAMLCSSASFSASWTDSTL